VLVCGIPFTGVLVYGVCPWLIALSVSK